MIIDCHAHCFPHLGGPGGFKSVDEHMMHAQWSIANHSVQPVRRLSDNRIIKEQTLWDMSRPTPEGRYDVNFRATGMGRYEWTKDGVDYYLMYMPPNLQNMTASPEFLIAYMDYLGIEKAVLQQSRIYGDLNEYYEQIVQKYPQRLIPLAQIEEGRAFEDDQILSLRNTIKNGKLGGLYFNTRSFPWTPAKIPFEQPEYKAFWDEVAALKIPVFWVIGGDLPRVLDRLLKWAESYSNIESVLVQGVSTKFLLQDDRIVIPQGIIDLVRGYPVSLEATYAISHGAWEEYPFPKANEIIRVFYDTFGAEKLMWGTDMPNVERFCTYSQSLEHVRKHCTFFSKPEMELVLGGNAARLFGLVSTSKTG